MYEFMIEMNMNIKSIMLCIIICLVLSILLFIVVSYFIIKFLRVNFDMNNILFYHSIDDIY